MAQAYGWIPDADPRRCRACGWDLGEPGWNPGPTYIICSLCGAECGVDDLDEEGAARYRARWIARGAPWFEPGERPVAWSVTDHLAAIGVVVDSPGGWHFEDAWILISLDPSPLLTINNADRINHAIPTFGELQTSLCRLVGSGLAEAQSSWFSRTPAGRRLVGSDVGGYDDARSVLTRLAALPLTPICVQVDTDVFERAVRDSTRPWALGRLWRWIVDARHS